MQKIVLASSNQGKLKEFRGLLEPLNLEVIPQAEFNVEDVEETGLSFVENALLKARHAAKITGLPALADDSGLEVDALQGAPGIYSSRFAGVDASSADNNTKLLADLVDIPAAERKANFRSILVFMRHAEDPTPLICQGSWSGLILDKIQGQGGFGYDPIFFVPELNKSAAELSPEQKNSLSHRGKASTELIKKLPAYIKF